METTVPHQSPTIPRRILCLSIVLLLLIHVIPLRAETAPTQEERISIQLKKAPIKKILEEIETKTPYHFFYNSADFGKTKEVKAVYKNRRVSQILQDILSKHNLTYVLLGKQIIIKPKNKLHNSLKKDSSAIQFVQVKDTIRGKVVDGNGIALPGVNISVNNGEHGTTTDFDGKYVLKVTKGDQVSFSFLGYEKQTIEIQDNNKTEINISMVESASTLDEAVVVGYGTTKKRDLTGTVGTIKSDDISQITTQSLDEALIGKIAGVFVQSAAGGRPGAGGHVYIRGLSSIRGDNQPLYVIDGVPVITTPNTEKLGLINYPVSDETNPLLAINPNDIERIDVLKDASATAIYGSRGANGVVLVTTKRGKRNRAPSFNFNIKTTLQNPVKKHRYLNGPEWVDWSKDVSLRAMEESGLPESQWPTSFPTQYKIVNDASYFGNADTNWQDLLTKNDAVWTDYHLGINGGTEDINYRVSLTASDQDGVLIKDNFKRYSLSSALDADINSYLKVGTTVNYNYSLRKYMGVNSLSQGDFRPDLAPYDEDGQFTTYEGPYGDQYTILGDLMQTRRRMETKDFLGSVYAEIDLYKGIKFKSQFSVGQNNVDMRNFNTSKSSTALFYGMYYSEPGARLAVQRNKSYSTTFENTLHYNGSFGNHNLDIVAGISWDKYRLDTESQNYRGFPDDDILTDLNSANFFDSADSESVEQGLNSIFGRINYNYDDKYLATFTARRDGSTKFGPNNRYGFFPSGALAWNINNEDFLKDVGFIDQLKLRGSYGISGSDDLPSFTYLAYYKSLENRDSFYDGINGIAVTGVPNPNIRWEETRQLDIGLEYELFNHRLNGEIVYYQKNTKGLILNVPLTYETGTTSWDANVADMYDKGMEFTIGGDIFRTSEFRWNSILNFATVKNKVTNLHDGFTTVPGVIEGKPLGTTRGYKVIKIAQTQDEIDQLNADAPGGVYQNSLNQPGDYIFADTNGDGIVDSDDRIGLGQNTPDFYGGWNNIFKYKNWEATMNWNFVSGVKKIYDELSNLYFVDPETNITPFVFEAWTPDQPNAKYARYGSGTNGPSANSRNVVGADYLKLRSASISYNFPRQWLKHTSVENVKLTLLGNNLITITNYPGLDPEDVTTNSFAGRATGYARDDGNSYPNIRTFSLILNVTF